MPVHREPVESEKKKKKRPTIIDPRSCHDGLGDGSGRSCPTLVSFQRSLLGVSQTRVGPSPTSSAVLSHFLYLKSVRGSASDPLVVCPSSG